MKSVVTMFAFVLAGSVILAAPKSQASESETNCHELAVASLSAKLNISSKFITSLGGAVVGDGGAVVDINILTVVAGKTSKGVYKPSSVDGAYTVEFENDSADTCEATRTDAEIRRLKG